jgi:AcrR family transcriptional regulator
VATSGSPGKRTRLAPEVRRAQLLEVARQLLVQHGPEAVTMEGIASEAGVNKALPYHYFTNAHAVLIEIYTQHNLELAARVMEAVAQPGSTDERIVAAVNAYLDVVVEHGAELTQLLRRGAGVIEEVNREQEPRSFVETLLVTHLRAPERHAPVAAGLVIGLLVGAADTCRTPGAQRSEVVAVTHAAIVAVLAAAHALGERAPSPDDGAQRRGA